ncbi:MAG: PilZ domain-containing protein [Leptospiraceae bacterium]|nr:PilZ domain-containing protein [Leptospiraceae bacterium]MCP5501522.1 PilZ domain-containing protein [Leptospiraceae bacterium]
MKQRVQGLIEHVYFNFFEKEFLKRHQNGVRIPVTINVLGDEYFLESSLITEKYLYLKVYEEDFDYLPEEDSNILIFLSLNLYSRGKAEMVTSLFAKESLNSGRIGLWLKILETSEEDKASIREFLIRYHSPRYSVRFSVLLSHRTIEKKHITSAINLSQNGIFLETELLDLKVGDRCRLLLYPQAKRIPIDAEVSWINNGNLYDKPNGYGFKFLHDSRSSYALRKLLYTLKNVSAQVR